MYTSDEIFTVYVLKAAHPKVSSIVQHDICYHAREPLAADIIVLTMSAEHFPEAPNMFYIYSSLHLSFYADSSWLA